MRINGSIEYHTHHGDDAEIIATWSVPYSADVDNGRCVDLEENGRPKLVALAVQVLDFTRLIPDPGDAELKQWACIWSRNHKYYEEELRTKFAADAVERYWEARSAA